MPLRRFYLRASASRQTKEEGQSKMSGSQARVYKTDSQEAQEDEQKSSNPVAKPGKGNHMTMMPHKPPSRADKRDFLKIAFTSHSDRCLKLIC